MEHGPQDPAVVEQALREWWASRST
jgi:hypothetical protein